MRLLSAEPRLSFGDQQAPIPDGPGFNSEPKPVPLQAADPMIAQGQLEERLAATQRELEACRQKVKELETRLWEGSGESQHNIHDPQLSQGPEQSSFQNIHNPEESQTEGHGLFGLQEAIDSIAHKIQLKRATMSVFQQQSIQGRNPSNFLRAPTRKSINILGNVPLKSMDKLAAYDEHYGVLSDINESKTNTEVKASKPSRLSVVIEATDDFPTQLAELKAENEKLQLENRNLRIALKRAHAEQTDLAMSVSKVLEASPPSPTGPPPPTGKTLDKSMIVFNTLTSGLQPLQEENEQLIQKYIVAINRIEDLEGTLDGVMRKFLAMARRDSETQFANIQLQGELLRLTKLLSYYSELI